MPRFGGWPVLAFPSTTIFRNGVGLDKRGCLLYLCWLYWREKAKCFYCFIVSYCSCSLPPTHFRSVVFDESFFTWNIKWAKLFHDQADWIGLVTYQWVTGGFSREACIINLIVFTVSSATYDSNRSQFRKDAYLFSYSLPIDTVERGRALKFFNTTKLLVSFIFNAVCLFLLF